MAGRILLVEAKEELAARLSSLLSAQGFEIDRASDGEAGFTRAVAGAYDLIIADFVLPVKGGLSLCRELRNRSIETAFILLTAAARTTERVCGLRFGADDCVPRSCDGDELVARVEALLRRLARSRSRTPGKLWFGDVEIDFGLGLVRKGGRPVDLAAKDLELLRYLADHRARVVSRQEILRKVWEYDAAISSRTVDVHVSWLRQKLEDNPRQPRHFKTIRGRGYRFDPG